MKKILCIAAATAVFTSCVFADLHDDLDDALESGEMEEAARLASEIVKKTPDAYTAVRSPSHPDSVFLYNKAVACYRLLRQTMSGISNPNANERGEQK